MSSSHDDERLLDALLADAREAPKPEDLARVEHRLGDWLGPAGKPVVRPGSHPLRSSKVLKPLLVIIGAGLMAQVFLDGSSAPESSSPPRVASSIAPPIDSAAPAKVSPPPPPAAVVPGASVAVADLPAVPESAPPPRVRPVDSPAPSTATRRSLAPQGSGPETSAAQKKPLVAEDVTESEASFLRRTRAALGDDPTRALRMTEEHASRYPQGVLVQERDVIAIDALVRLGARDEARARAKAFQARYPKSAHASRIAALVGTEAP